MKARSLMLSATVVTLMCFAGSALADCAGIAFASAQKGQGKFETTFSATEIMDIDFYVLFTVGAAQRLKGDHQAEVRINTPSGALYQSISIPFSSETRKAGTSRSLPGYPRPIKVEILSSVGVGNSGNMAIPVHLPVAGTPIVTNSLYGTWSATVFIDNETLPCAKSAQFSISQ